MIDDIKPLIGKLSTFAKDRLGFSRPPKLFLKKDQDNSLKLLGKTAYYSPEDEAVTLYVTGRHPKDILRSLAHELVHHTQNLRGDLSAEKVLYIVPFFNFNSPIDLFQFSTRSGSMQESKPETPSTQVSRPSPKVGVTIAILELGLVNP
mgnify:CR=1 FL=1